MSIHVYQIFTAEKKNQIGGGGSSLLECEKVSGLVKLFIFNCPVTPTFITQTKTDPIKKSICILPYTGS